MTNFVAVVLGATGTVGSGAVKRFLQDPGTVVIAPVRGSPEKLLQAIGEVDTSRLRTPEIQYGERAGAQALAQWIRENVDGGVVDHVFAVGGGMAPYGPVSLITPETLEETIQLKLYTILNPAQALIPLLKDETTSTFTVITGMLGEYCPAPNLALTAIGNASVFGLVAALQSEARGGGKNYRINDFRIAALICPDGQSTNPSWRGNGAPTSTLAKFYFEKIIETDIRDSIVRVNPADVGL
jgi:NAD(P)-dependent dehydrogenase (short-subunit alcohol dehydrogenase family)